MGLKTFLSGGWPWWVTGVLMAISGVALLYLFDDYPGMSDGMLMTVEFARRAAEEKSLNEPPPLDWQTGFLGGIFVGALACAFISGKWKLALMPEGTEGGWMFGSGKAIISGLAGGFLVMLGLQMAGDSFFGQWMSVIQVSAAAWVFMIAFIVASVITAILMARRAGGDK